MPGGGEFADTVRLLDKRFGLSDGVSHRMAILSMDQFGLLLSDLISDSYVSSELEDIINPANGMLPIFLPAKHLFSEDPFEPSWNVTSDTIAAYAADKLGAKKLILVTDVDGIFSENPRHSENLKLIEMMSAKELSDRNKRTSVDKTLPKMLLHARLECYVVNGRYPERIKLILEDKKTICTHITV